MTLSSARTDRFGHFEMVDVIAKTSRDSLGGKFETSTANIVEEIFVDLKNHMSKKQTNIF